MKQNFIKPNWFPKGANSVGLRISLGGLGLNWIYLFIYVLSLPPVNTGLLCDLQTWLHAVVLLGSGIFYYAFVLVFSITCVTCNSPTNLFGIETRLMSEPLYYCVCGLTTALALLPRYTHTHLYIHNYKQFQDSVPAEHFTFSSV